MDILGFLSPVRIFLVLGLYALIPLALISAGLFIFFWGRRYVERKYGKKD